MHSHIERIFSFPAWFTKFYFKIVKQEKPNKYININNAQQQWNEYKSNI